MATSGPENSSELFHVRGAATENDRSPRVDRVTGGTIRVAVEPVADERR